MQRETPLSETKQVKGLEDILLLDVQGSLSATQHHLSMLLASCPDT